MACGFMPDWADALIKLALPNGNAERYAWFVDLIGDIVMNRPGKPLDG
jgi:hypothetical protein